ncbi:Hypothetical protein CAP_0461 [Chondromyces apiculatus DSM 436]|uniref:Uncharacterized protein n=1 Tax=Chondromyces apiculatus DSM 436 TaxID=1192034 RepID=A0A017SVI3_9BACT|nr:Hypothetical protein CAP_0461 [Chondromyces apiculatus DSM 436]
MSAYAVDEGSCRAPGDVVRGGQGLLSRARYQRPQRMKGPVARVGRGGGGMLRKREVPAVLHVSGTMRAA